MLKAFKYKLNPTDSQKVFLNKHFGCTRFIFNFFLNQRITEYQTNSKSLSIYDNYKELTSLKGVDDFNWLREVNSQSLQDSVKNLDASFKNFFKHKSGFPNFKSKHRKNSFCVPQNVKCFKNKLIIEDNTARLLLAYGNGMWNKTICDDNEILREVYDLLIMRLNIKKVNIIQKMKEI